LSLPTGQKIKIKALGSKQFDKSKSHNNNNNNNNSNNNPDLTRHSPLETSSSTVSDTASRGISAVETASGEDEWGDFESAQS